MKRLTTTAVKIIAASTLLAMAGCKKENYEDPTAFLRKYILEDFVLKGPMPELMQKLHFKKIEMEDVHLRPHYDQTMVCATLRLMPESDDIVYVLKPSQNQALVQYGIEEGVERVLSPDELKEKLSARVEVLRTKLDNGVFVPAIGVDDPEELAKCIKGWRAIVRLEVLEPGSKPATSQIPQADPKLVEAMCRMGRELFVDILQANMERNAHGRDHMWPQSGRAACTGTPYDIAEVSFSNSTEYFRILFDLANANGSMWTPYVSASPQTALDQRTAESVWSIALNLPDGLLGFEETPVLVSSNLDCSRLLSDSARNVNLDGVVALSDHPIIGRGAAVIIYGNGSAKALTADKVTLRNIYGAKSGKLPRQYLTPRGVVAVGGSK